MASRKSSRSRAGAMIAFIASVGAGKVCEHCNENKEDVQPYNVSQWFGPQADVRHYCMECAKRVGVAK